MLQQERKREYKINVPNEEFFMEYNKEIYKILDNIEEIQKLLNYTTECLIEKDTRIEKAIEYIDEMCLCSSGYFDYGDDLSPKHIVDILKGVNDD